MKRQSAVEKELRRQVEMIEQEIKTLYDEINHRHSQISALAKIAESMRFQLETMKASANAPTR